MRPMRTRLFFLLCLFLLVLPACGIADMLNGSIPPDYAAAKLKERMKRPAYPSARKAAFQGTQFTSSGGYKYDLDWSNNGQWIAYEQDGDIFIAAPDNSAAANAPVNVSADLDGLSYLPVFTPDSAELVFMYWDQNASGDIHAYSVDLATFSKEIFLTGMEVYGWSNDMRYLVYGGFFENTFYEVVVYDAEQDVNTTLRAVENGYAYSAAFHPDGSQVAVTVDDENFYQQIYLYPLPPVTDGFWQITTGEIQSWVDDWSPDGRWIAVTDDTNGNIAAFNYEDGDMLPVFVNPDEYTIRSAFSPDGSELAYIAELGDGSMEIFIAEFPYAGGEASISLVTPDGAELTGGSTVDITWDAHGGETVHIEFSNDGGVQWQTVEQSIPAGDGVYAWQVPEIDAEDCRVRITLIAAGTIVDSDTSPLFSIAGGAPVRTVRLLSPNGGEVLPSGTSYEITWSAQGIVQVNLLFSSDDGTSWTPIVTGVAASDGMYQWTVPTTVQSTTCLIKVRSASDTAAAEDTSNDTFTIEGGSAGRMEQVFRFQTDDAITLASPAMAVDKTIYIASQDGYLYAVNPDGSLKWQYSVGKSMSNATVAQDGTIYIATVAGRLYALNPDGTRKWLYNSGSMILSSPALGMDGTLYFGTYDQRLIAVRANGVKAWERYLDSEIYSSPAIGLDGTVYVGTAAGFLYAYAANGDYIWDTYIGESIFSSPAIDDNGTIYIGATGSVNTSTVTSPTGLVAALYPADGTVKWVTGLDGTAVESSPVITGEGGIVIADQDNNASSGRLYFLDADSGNIGTSYAMDGIVVSTPVAAGDGTVYVGADDGRVYGFQYASGLVSNFKLGGSTWSSPVLSDQGILYIGAYDGALYAIDTGTGATPADSPWPSFQRDNRNSGRIRRAVSTFVRVLSPDGREYFTSDGKMDISWVSNGVSLLNIRFSTDAGDTWELAAPNVDAAAESYSWNIPSGVDSDRCLIRLEDTSDTTVFDVSNDVFSVTPGSHVEVLAPNGGQEWRIGSAREIRFDAGGLDTVAIDYSTDNGESWTAIAGDVSTDKGFYVWTVPDDQSDTCLIRVREETDGGVSDVSDGVFAIVPDTYIRITSPAFGERWSTGSEKDITWEFNSVDTVTIELSLDDGGTWEELVSSVSAASGAWSWRIGETESEAAVIRITDTSDSAVSDISDRFEILRPELIIEHAPVTRAGQTQEITFSADVTATTDISSVMLYYDTTGGREFTDTLELLNTGGDTYSVTMEIGEFTAEGMEYYLVARDANNQKTRSPADAGFYSITADVEDMNATFAIPGSGEQAGYRMVSIPLDLTATDIESQMKDRLPPGDAGVDWRLFRFMPGEGEPEEYPDISSGFEPGAAFWIITQQDYTLEAPGGTTVSTAEPFLITLKSGWNDIGNPWMFNISWQDIENPSNAQLSPLYEYENGWSDPVNPPTELEPWRGYAVRNMENHTVVIKLQPQPVTAKPAKRAAQDGWTVQLEATAGTARDTANYLGVRRASSTGWDTHDYAEPPPIGEYVSVRFPHGDWDRYPGDYTTDMRPDSNTISWPFTVTTNSPDATVGVRMTGLATLPAGSHYRVTDAETGREVPVTDGGFSFDAGDAGAEREFVFTVSETPFADDTASRPERYLAAVAYPNPFNPRTTIEFETGGTETVKVRVYNALGQVVRTWDVGVCEPGRHAVEFDARGLTSGVYFYVVETGRSSVSGKMLYMK